MGTIDLPSLGVLTIGSLALAGACAYLAVDGWFRR